MFIELHASLLKHKKVRRLAERLKITRRDARGLLATLWLEVLDTEPMTGDLSRWTAADVAEAAEWQGDPDVLIEALTHEDSLFLDSRGSGWAVHKWEKYTTFLRKKLRNAERMREVRARKEEQECVHSARTVHARSRTKGMQPEPKPEPEPEPEPNPSQLAPRERGMNLEEIERAGFERFGMLGGVAAASLSRFVPVARTEWEAILKTRGHSWAYAAKVLAGMREESARGPARAASDPLDFERLKADLIKSCEANGGIIHGRGANGVGSALSRSERNLPDGPGE